jgi:hypothetical protein
VQRVRGLVTVRRIALLLVGLLVGAAGVVGIEYFLSTRDKANISSQQGPGTELPDQGRRHLRPGQRPGVRYASSPPASGPHVEVIITRDATTFNNDQLLQALELGNVVLAYPEHTPPPALRTLARQLNQGGFDPNVAAAGQAVLLARRPRLEGIVALSWRHILHVSSPSDPRLAEFATYWLDHAAP